MTMKDSSITGGLIFPRINAKFVYDKLIAAIRNKFVAFLLNYFDTSVLVH